MCLVHIVRYAGCDHVHSYAEFVHEDAAYCPNQQVIHNGMAKEQDKCSDCIKKDRELSRAMKECLEAGQDDSSNSSGSKTGSEAATELEFVENYFGGEPEARSVGGASGSGLAGSRQEWQLVQEADTKGHEIAGWEDEVVIFGYGKEQSEGLDVDGESKWITLGQILPRTIGAGQESNTNETGRRRARVPGARSCGEENGGAALSGGDRDPEAGGVRQDRKSATESVKKEERKETGARRSSWSMTGRGR